MFVSRGLPTCKMLISENVYGFMTSAKMSCNTILQNIVGSDHIHVQIAPALEAYAISTCMHSSQSSFDSVAEFVYYMDVIFRNNVDLIIY